MSLGRNENHKTQVDAWEAQNARGLSADKLVTLYQHAITAIERRSLQTLSDVTVSIVIDRVLHESKEKFPSLAEVTQEASGIKIPKQLHHRAKPEELRSALGHLLLEIISVIGSITADVLTLPLHKELEAVTADQVFKGTLRAVSSSKKDQGDS